MNANIFIENGRYVGAGLVGILAMSVAITSRLGIQLPLISGERAAFFALAVLGFAMCMLVMGGSVEANGWDLFNIVAAGLGALAIMLVLTILASINVPFIAGERTALIALTIIILAKWGLATLHRFLASQA